MTAPRHVYRWDLDKTYLHTEFDRVRDLVKSAFEGAEAKRAVPGAAALLRELKRGDGARTLAIADSVRPSTGADVVGRIFIRLDRHSPTARFDRYGSRLVPVHNYFQAALVLLEDGLLDADATIRIALGMVDQFGYSL